jgi:hypothetical protein
MHWREAPILNRAIPNFMKKTVESALVFRDSFILIENYGISMRMHQLFFTGRIT